MKVSKRLTFGESWYDMKQQSNSMSITFDEVATRPASMPRMTRRNAVKHYNRKCSETFAVLGIVKRVRVVDDFESRLPFVIEKVRKASNVMIRKEARKNNILLMEMVS